MLVSILARRRQKGLGDGTRRAIAAGRLVGFGVAVMFKGVFNDAQAGREHLDSDGDETQDPRRTRQDSSQQAARLTRKLFAKALHRGNLGVM
jgi:hypothetical protein